MQVTESTRALINIARELDPKSAADALARYHDAEIAGVLATLGPARAVEILQRFTPERRTGITGAALSGQGEQWLHDQSYAEGSVGRLMERVPAIFLPDAEVSEVIESLREAVRHTLITYIFVVDAHQHLLGVVAFRELVFASPQQRLREVMLPKPFSLRPETALVDAMREVVTRHYPVYPVCDSQQRLIGVVRGQLLFEQQAFEISAQAGSMVGVEREERTATPWARSLRLRHPWLQLNLITAFVAASVVGLFQGTVNRIVILAIFIPVLSGQCSNTGCQSLAVTLRGMTLKELTADRAGALIAKEAWLGFINGALTGLVAAIGMYAVARSQNNPSALVLALITLVAMALSCLISGVAGAAVPLALKRAGADPATASSIFLTTATDVVSMGLFLGMAAWLIP